MSIPFNGLTALAVEDDGLVRDDIASGLRQEGWEVLEAATGASSVKWLQEIKSLDVLIADIGPADETTGWDVAEAVRALYPSLLVIYASGGPSNDGRRVPESIFLSKPVAPGTYWPPAAHFFAAGDSGRRRKYRYGLTPDQINIVIGLFRRSGGLQIIARESRLAGSPERLSGALAAEHYVAIVQ
jgi:CheY-like chemotaxis protein